MRFLALKIAFFEGFENDDILSSKSYTVTKRGKKFGGQVLSYELKF